jgi:type III pantothenate kinase
VDLVKPARVIGKDSVGALQSGLILGHAAMVDGVVKRIQAESGQAGTVIATGELATPIACDVPSIDRTEPHLTLIGLRIIYELNHAA